MHLWYNLFALQNDRPLLNWKKKAQHRTRWLNFVESIWVDSYILKLLKKIKENKLKISFNNFHGTPLRFFFLFHSVRAVLSSLLILIIITNPFYSWYSTALKFSKLLHQQTNKNAFFFPFPSEIDSPIFIFKVSTPF